MGLLRPFRPGTVLAPGPRIMWFDARGGRLRFLGRVTKQPVVDWLATPEGSQAVETAARGMRFSLFGRVRSARRRLRREVLEGLTAPGLADPLAAECDRYLKAWTELAYAPSLPRATVALRRLVVVPRTLILGRTLSRLTVRLAACQPLASLPEDFNVFFSRWVLDDMDRAIRRAAPSPRRPVVAPESWVCVALDSDFTWVDPMWSGADWRGHVMMYEMPPNGLRRRERHELEGAIEQLRQSLPGLSRQQRDSTVRQAVDGMTLLQV